MLATGCESAFAPQSVDIFPKVDVQSSQIGAGHTIKLSVIDERPRQTLGIRGANQTGSNLTIEGNLSAIVQGALVEGLERQNFKPVDGSGKESRELRVEIRNLDYTVLQEFWYIKLNIDTTLKAFCIQSTQRPYEQLYRGEFVKNVQLIQSREENSSHISSALSTAVNSLLADQKLLACLNE